MIFLNLVICLLHVVMLINYIKYNVVLALVVTFFPNCVINVCNSLPSTVDFTTRICVVLINR